MRVTRDSIYTTINSAEPTELALLRSFLSGFDDDKPSLLFEGQKFHTGLLSLLADRDFNIEIEEDHLPERVAISDLQVDPNILDGIELRDYQIAAVRKSVYAGQAVVEAATGAGKTCMAAATIQQLRKLGKAQTALVLAPSGFLMQQMADAFESFGLGKVCRIGYGHKYKPGFDIYVAVVNSAHRLCSTKSTLCNVDILAIDEGHHLSADSWVDVCTKVKAPYRFAYTATVLDDPQKLSYNDLLLFGLIGPVVFEVKSKMLRDRGLLAEPVVTMLDTHTANVPSYSWNTVYNIGIAGNRVRNSMIVSLASSCYRASYKTMIFVGRKKHGHVLAEYLSKSEGCECVFVHGGAAAHIYKASGTSELKRWSVGDLANYVNSRDKVIVITSNFLDEGLDIPVVNVLIMATAMKKYRRTVQRSGRGMRPKEDGDNNVYIFDFIDDNHVFLSKQSKYRLWTYQEEQFTISESLHHTEQLMKCELDVNQGLFPKKRKAAK